MKNSKTLTYRGLKMRTIKNAKALRFEQDFMLQVPPEYRNLRLGGPLRANVTVYYPNHRQDLDVALIFDLLQKSGVIENDRNLIEQHLFRKVSAADPRCEIEIESVSVNSVFSLGSAHVSTIQKTKEEKAGE